MRVTNSRELCGSFAGGRKGGKEGDHRHRMTEQEEDEEILNELNQVWPLTLFFVSFL